MTIYCIIDPLRVFNTENNTVEAMECNWDINAKT